MAFNKDNKLLSLHNFLKNQDIDATDGLNTISYYLIPRDSSFEIVMSHARHGGTLNEIQFIHFDYINDKVLDDKFMENPEKLVLTRPYMVNEENILYFVGRKGVLGKKTFLVKYKL